MRTKVRKSIKIQLNDYSILDGVQYHPVEWEAYKVGSKNLTKCVDLFIPYKHCVMDQGRSLMQSDFG